MESAHLQKTDVNRRHESEPFLLCSAGFPTGDADWKVGVTGSRFMESPWFLTDLLTGQEPWLRHRTHLPRREGATARAVSWVGRDSVEP